MTESGDGRLLTLAPRDALGGAIRPEVIGRLPPRDKAYSMNRVCQFLIVLSLYSPGRSSRQAASQRPGRVLLGVFERDACQRSLLGAGTDLSGPTLRGEQTADPL